MIIIGAMKMKSLIPITINNPNINAMDINIKIVFASLVIT